MENEKENILKRQIMGIVSWQFSGVTNLTEEAYNDSLRIIAEQVLEEIKKLK